MLWVNVKRIVKSGFYNFWRNAFVSLSSVLVMIITLSVIASIVFLGAILNSALDELKNKVDVNVYFVPKAEEEDILTVKKNLETLPEIALVTYEDESTVLANFRKRHENDEFTLQALDELGVNPLGAVLNIKATDPSQYESIAKFLQGKNVLSKEGVSIVEKVNYYQNKVAIDKLSKIIESADRLGLVLTIVLAIISILITLNTIRLAIYIAREEIAVMRLVGASNMYIRGPFVITGIMYGVLSAIITLIIFYPITLWLGKVTENFFAGINVFDYYLSNFAQIFLLIILSGIAIGAISSFLAVKKYLSA